MKTGHMVTFSDESFDNNGTPIDLPGGTFMEVWPESASDVFFLQYLKNLGKARPDTRTGERSYTLPIMVCQSEVPEIYGRIQSEQNKHTIKSIRSVKSRRSSIPPK